MNSVNISLATLDEVQDVGSWLRKGLRTFNQGFWGTAEVRPVAAVAKVDDQLVGGIWGVVVLDWLSIEIAFLDEKYRGQGLGESMLFALEEEGRRLGATRAFVDTTTFQAEGFYAKFGYVEWGRFRDFAPGIDRVYLRKDKL